MPSPPNTSGCGNLHGAKPQPLHSSGLMDLKTPASPSPLSRTNEIHKVMQSSSVNGRSRASSKKKGSSNSNSSSNSSNTSSSNSNSHSSNYGQSGSSDATRNAGSNSSGAAANAPASPFWNRVFPWSVASAIMSPKSSPMKSLSPFKSVESLQHQNAGMAGPNARRAQSALALSPSVLSNRISIDLDDDVACSPAETVPEQFNLHAPTPARRPLAPKDSDTPTPAPHAQNATPAHAQHQQRGISPSVAAATAAAAAKSARRVQSAVPFQNSPLKKLHDFWHPPPPPSPPPVPANPPAPAVASAAERAAAATPPRHELVDEFFSPRTSPSGSFSAVAAAEPRGTAAGSAEKPTQSATFRHAGSFSMPLPEDGFGDSLLEVSARLDSSNSAFGGEWEMHPAINANAHVPNQQKRSAALLELREETNLDSDDCDVGLVVGNSSDLGVEYEVMPGTDSAPFVVESPAQSVAGERRKVLSPHGANMEGFPASGAFGTGYSTPKILGLSLAESANTALNPFTDHGSGVRLSEKKNNSNADFFGINGIHSHSARNTSPAPGRYAPIYTGGAHSSAGSSGRRSDDLLVKFDSPVNSVRTPLGSGGRYPANGFVGNAAASVAAYAAAGGPRSHSDAARGYYKPSVPTATMYELHSVFSTPNSVPKYSERDVAAIRAEITGKFEKDFELAQMEIQDLENRRIQAVEEAANIRATMDEWEAFMKDVIAKKELDDACNQTELKALRNALEKSQTDREKACKEHDELAVRYRQLRLDLEDEREASHRHRRLHEEALEQIRVCKMQYENLKTHAENKLESANVEIARVRAQLEKEIAALRIKNTRAELHIASLEKTVETKVQENSELTKICDDLLMQIENMTGS